MLREARRFMEGDILREWDWMTNGEGRLLISGFSCFFFNFLDGLWSYDLAEGKMTSVLFLCLFLWCIDYLRDEDGQGGRSTSLSISLL